MTSSAPRPGRAGSSTSGCARPTPACRRDRCRACSRTRSSRSSNRATEDDGFNRLVLAAGLSWREVSLLRAYSRYLRQVGTLYSQAYIEDALAAHPELARGARRTVRRPARSVDRTGRATPTVSSTSSTRRPRRGDQPRRGSDPAQPSRTSCSRRCARTGSSRARSDERRPTIVLKLDPNRIPDCPAPRPMYEIFVYSPRVEGVHLRAGKVARGGIRWSDRREDFRTEVLGLMKAQKVKNVVIVPSGAKGGFVVKRPPVGRDELSAEVEACYRVVHRGLARRHRQSRRRRDRRACRRSSATTATTPISSSRPTRAPRPSPTSPTRSPSRAASGSVTRSRRAAPPATTTRRWASPRGAHGNR